MAVCSRNCKSLVFVVMGQTMLVKRTAFGQMQPVLNTVFPAGAQAGQSVDVTLADNGLEELRTLQSSIPGMSCERLDANRVRLTIPENAPLGQHDLWAVSDNGISSPRMCVIGNRRELVESEPNDVASEPMPVPLDSVINGQVGEVDHFRFEAKQGQRVVIECSAERIDSRLRAVLEVFDLTGKRLAANRGYFGIDPLIDFRVPIDGSYAIRIHDLTSSGSAEH